MLGREDLGCGEGKGWPQGCGWAAQLLPGCMVVAIPLARETLRLHYSGVAQPLLQES